MDFELELGSVQKTIFVYNILYCNLFCKEEGNKKVVVVASALPPFLEISYCEIVLTIS